MKIFLDTEFTGLHQGTTLISIGITTEKGNNFYAEFNDYDKTQVNEWLQANVVDKLKYNNVEEFLDEDDMDFIRIKGNTNQVKEKLVEFLDSQRGSEKVEVWSDCLAYDWVLFNQLFDHAFNLPEFIYYIPFDICVLFKIKGIDPDVSREDFVHTFMLDMIDDKHNSLYDSLIIKLCYDKLMSNIKEY